MAGGYRQTADLPQVIPVFPLDGALLLPRRRPAAADLRAALSQHGRRRHGRRPDDRHDPDPAGRRRASGRSWPTSAAPAGSPAIAETADGRYLITLTGVCRFDAGEELPVPTPYRQVRAGLRRASTATCAEDDDAEAFDRAPLPDAR